MKYLRISPDFLGLEKKPTPPNKISKAELERLPDAKAIIDDIFRIVAANRKYRNISDSYSDAREFFPEVVQKALEAYSEYDPTAYCYPQNGLDATSFKGTFLGAYSMHKKHKAEIDRIAKTYGLFCVSFALDKKHFLFAWSPITRPGEGGHGRAFLSCEHSVQVMIKILGSVKDWGRDVPDVKDAERVVKKSSRICCSISSKSSVMSRRFNSNLNPQNM